VTSHSKYCEILGRFYGLVRFGEKLSLDGPRALNRDLGDPLSRYPSVLVGGTNGKGSTCAFLETALRASGLRTGLFTSPHLVSFTERIRINGDPVTMDWVCANAPDVLDLAEPASASFFEAAWGLAAKAFREFEVDIAIWEVGLGGRLDATNVAEPVAAAITSIGLDHTHVLGETLSEIASEKSAIFRSATPALTGATGLGLSALQAVAPPHLQHVLCRDDLPDLALPGAHNKRNASLALAMSESLGYHPPASCLSETRWPGRGERIDDVLLDCAHNPHALIALGEWLHDSNLGPLHIIFGAMEGKDVSEMASIIQGWSTSIVLVTPEYPRRVEAESLRPLFDDAEAQVINHLSEALDQRPKDRITLVCGSGFLVGEARAALMGVKFPECGLSTLAR